MGERSSNGSGSRKKRIWYSHWESSARAFASDYQRLPKGWARRCNFCLVCRHHHLHYHHIRYNRHYHHCTTIPIAFTWFLCIAMAFVFLFCFYPSPILQRKHVIKNSLAIITSFSRARKTQKPLRLVAGCGRFSSCFSLWNDARRRHNPFERHENEKKGVYCTYMHPQENGSDWFRK